MQERLYCHTHENVRTPSTYGSLALKNAAPLFKVSGAPDGGMPDSQIGELRICKQEVFEDVGAPALHGPILYYKVAVKQH